MRQNNVKSPQTYRENEWKTAFKNVQKKTCFHSNNLHLFSWKYFNLLSNISTYLKMKLKSATSKLRHYLRYFCVRNVTSADSHSLWWEFCHYPQYFTPVLIKKFCHYLRYVHLFVETTQTCNPQKFRYCLQYFWVAIMKCHVCMWEVQKNIGVIGGIFGRSIYRRYWRYFWEFNISEILAIFLRVKKIGVTGDIFGRSTYRRYQRYFESEFIQLHKMS